MKKISITRNEEKYKKSFLIVFNATLHVIDVWENTRKRRGFMGVNICAEKKNSFQSLKTIYFARYN